ncbi:hypothetical protein [Burkholderia multivorans]|uniref:hypothetical protein n=1 Tax=Burkholderia multivorans TaxID=87883 RepID=UPI0028568FDE|nr:hypothetical protein [Burkholderia multivorans]MDR9060627.1 hypothetical protein [Burkholderia multivorans]MDR9084104.1 hypothetical protein [Burkholderia multivorans]MDR9096305.1 hypothetical protein [Burkholderia multivorans]MDR9101546.1 hypothetical protein [Burkholderia multivorans]MDR9106881.1 hypothetical protein [Burkholderia multivorans]
MSDRRIINIELVPGGRFIKDQEGRKVCEMMWPGYLIRPCRGRVIVEPGTPEDAEFWGIYVEEEDGCERWVADADSREAAEQKLARLIAAAPDLLAALEACVTQIEQMRGLFDDSDGAIQAALEDAQKAINKAGGAT